VQTSKSKKRFKLNKKQKDMIFYTVIIALPLLQFLIFYVGVNVNSVMLSFFSYDVNKGSYYWNNFKNFELFLFEFQSMSLFKAAFYNSIVAFVAGIIGKILSLLFSFYIYKKFRGHKFFKVILFMPSIISSIVMVTIFLQFVESGIPNIMSHVFDFEMLGFLANHKTTFGTIIFYNIWIGFGISILLYVGAMENINPSLIEAAKIDGANQFHEFFHVVMPMIWPTFVQLTVVSVAGIFINQLNLFAFYGEHTQSRLYTFGYYLYRGVLKASAADYPYLATVGIILTLISIPTVVIVRKLLLKYGPKVD